MLGCLQIMHFNVSVIIYTFVYQLNDLNMFSINDQAVDLLQKLVNKSFLFDVHLTFRAKIRSITYVYGPESVLALEAAWIATCLK